MTGIIHFVQITPCYLLLTRFPTLMLPGTSQLLPVLWTLEHVKTDLDAFYGPKLTQTTWMLNLLCSRETTINIFARCKVLQRGKANFNQFMRLMNQLVFATENFGREDNFSAVLIPTMSKDMAEQVKHAHKKIDVVDPVSKKNFVTLLRYNVEQSESFLIKSQCLPGGMRTRSFNNVLMWNINLKSSISSSCNEISIWESEK